MLHYYTSWKHQKALQFRNSTLETNGLKLTNKDARPNEHKNEIERR